MPKPRLACAAALLLAAGPAWGGALPPAVIHPNLFNSDQNVPPTDQPPGLVNSISFSSGVFGTDTPEDAFGNEDGDTEPGTFIFGDSGGVADNGNETIGDGGETVDFLEWTTATPVNLLGYHLRLTQLDAFDRTAQLIVFSVDGVEQDSFDNDGATGASGSIVLEISRPFGTIVQGSTFRLDVTRSSNGPRITEIDALTVSFCGNTTVEGSEECDDGNTVAGDGCDACVLEPGCPLAPDPACVAAAKASLSINETKPGKEKLTAKLSAFAAGTTQADFGNPATGSTRYDLCIYDAKGTRVADLVVNEAGEECGPKNKPCWKDKKGKGWAYGDPEADASGVRKITATSGPAGKGKLQVQAGNNEPKGQDEMPIGIAGLLSGASSATVQLQTSDGLCFGATLSTIKKAEGGVFQGKAP